MPKQLTDNWETKSRAGADTRVGVTQVVNANIIKTSAFCYGTPWPVEVCARLLGVIARDDTYRVAAEPDRTLVSLEQPRSFGPLTLFPFEQAQRPRDSPIVTSLLGGRRLPH
jgi:hypothetical protein